MATSGSGTLYPNNATYSCEVRYSWTRNSSGVVSWTAVITGINGDTDPLASSPCWTSFFIRGGKNAQNNLTGDLTSYCATCDQCAAYYQGRILWQSTQSGTIDMGASGGTLKLGYYGQRNGSNTSEEYLTWTVDAILPPAPTMSLNSAFKDNIRMNYTAQTNGLSVTVQYSLDGGAWKQIQTSSSDMSGIFVILNLLPNSTHTVAIRSHTSGGNVNGPTLTVSTADTPAKWYGSVNNTRKRAKKMYCSVNNTRKRVKKIYGSVNGARELVYEDPNL